MLVEGQVEQGKATTLRPQVPTSTMPVVVVVMAMAAALLREVLAVAAQASIMVLPFPLRGPPTQVEEGEVPEFLQEVQAAPGLSFSATRLLLTVDQPTANSSSLRWTY
jgi:hypothetical protein